MSEKNFWKMACRENLVSEKCRVGKRFRKNIVSENLLVGAVDDGIMSCRRYIVVSGKSCVGNMSCRKYVVSEKRCRENVVESSPLTFQLASSLWIVDLCWLYNFLIFSHDILQTTFSFAILFNHSDNRWFTDSSNLSDLPNSFWNFLCKSDVLVDVL